MNIASKMIIEACKARPGSPGARLRLNVTLYDTLIEELCAARFVNNGSSGCWISPDKSLEDRPAYVWLYGTKITFVKNSR